MARRAVNAGIGSSGKPCAQGFLVARFAPVDPVALSRGGQVHEAGRQAARLITKIPGLRRVEDERGR